MSDKAREVGAWLIVAFYLAICGLLMLWPIITNMPPDAVEAYGRYNTKFVMSALPGIVLGAWTIVSGRRTRLQQGKPAPDPRPSQEPKMPTPDLAVKAPPKKRNPRGTT